MQQAVWAQYIENFESHAPDVTPAIPSRLPAARLGISPMRVILLFCRATPLQSSIG